MGKNRHRVITALSGVALVVAALGVCAQTPAAEPDVAQVECFANARLIDGRGEVLDNATLRIRGDVILDVGVSNPGCDITHDLTGKTVIPALVNTHAHLGWEAYGDWGSQFFTDENLIDHLYRHAYYGVGTIISTGSDKEDVALRVSLEQLKGNIGGARYHLSPGLGSPGGGPNPRFTDDPDYWGVNPVADPEQGVRTVRDLAARGYRIAKIWIDDRDERRGAQIKVAPEIYRAVLNEAANQDMRIIAHATTLADHKTLVAAGNRRSSHALRGRGRTKLEWPRLMFTSCRPWHDHQARALDVRHLGPLLPTSVPPLCLIG